MATYTTSITIKGDELGNAPSWYMFSGLVQGEGYNLTANASLTDWCDQIVADALNGTWGYTMTYSISGSTTLNTGTPSVITFNILNPTDIPLLIVINTEDNYYAASFANPLSICEGAYEVTLTACEDNYIIPAGLTPSSLYYFSIETNRGKRYVQHVSTNGSGDIQLWSAAPEFPVGFFTPEMFTYTCKAYTDSNLTSQVQFTIDNIVYNSLNIKFIYTIITSD
jgi:hypothetical protein